MDDTTRNNFIVNISKKITEDNTPLNEQDVSILENYEKFAVSLGVDESEAAEIVNEAFLYLSMKNAGDVDPLTKGDQFGAGFS